MILDISHLPTHQCSFLGTASLQSAGSSYAFTRLIQLRPKDINCGLHSFHQVQQEFYPFFHLSDMYSFLPKVSSQYFIQNPLDHLNYHNIPKVMNVKASVLGITLKNKLGCLLEPLDASSDLDRSIDLLVKTMKRRLSVSDQVLRLIVKRNELSEPLQYLWYSN